MNVPDWPWIVGGLFLLLMGLFFGVNLGRVGEQARHGNPAKQTDDDQPRMTQPKVNWGSINLDLSTPDKNKGSDKQQLPH